MAEIELADGFVEMASTLVAVEVGFRAVHALPGQGLADVVTIGLSRPRAIHHGAVVTEQRQTARDTRVPIEPTTVDGSEWTHPRGPRPDGRDAGDRSRMSVDP
jgi:hypothetical protein